jgi:hypothetical protein
MGYAVSIWNRIGDVASTVSKYAANDLAGVARGATNVVKFGGELLGAAGGVAKFGWDVGTAPWNDAAEYNGFVQTFKSAALEDGKNIVKPFASAGGAIMKVPGVQPALERINYINQNYIREPLTTVALVQGDVNGGRASFFDPNEWSKAFKGAQDISFGQAVVGQYRSFYDPKFNIYDPREREQAFQKSAWGKGLSGGVDLFAQFFGDVTLAGGKVAKAVKASELGVGLLKNADAVAKAAEDITKAQYGVENRFTKVIDDFTKNGSAYALSHPMVKSSTQPGLLAHLLGDSVDKDETALILRSALGDPAAMDELGLQRAYIKDALEAARGDLSTVDEHKLFSAPDGTGMIPFLNADPAVIEAARANYASLAASDKYFSNLMGLGEGGGALTRTTGKLAQGAENFVAEARATRFYDKNVGNPNIEVFQPTPFHRLYQKISWSAGERPAGLVDFNDPDSYREIVASVNQATRLLDLAPNQSKKMLDRYIAAATPEERAVATMVLEGTVFRDLAKKYGVDEEYANKIYNGYKGARLSALKSIQDKGFMVDTDGSILKVPQLESQSADYLPMMDFNLMNTLLKRNASTLNQVVGSTTGTVMHYADVLQDAFKAGALLRLGYTIRNGIDSQLRIATAVGAMASLRHLGPGTKNFINNSIRVPSRLADRYLPVHDGMNIRSVQQGANKVINELNVLKKQIADAETTLSIKPDDTDSITKLNTYKMLQEEKQAVYQHYTEVINRVGTVKPKARIGGGSYEVTTSDGQKYELYDAFGGPLGDMFRRIASSENSFQRIVEGNSDALAKKLSSKGIGVVKPTDPGYFEQWAQTLRQQFGNSAVVTKLAAGESLEDITKWLRSSEKGRDLRKRLAIPSDESGEYVTKINGFLDQYLPASSGLRSKIKDVTANDLRSTFKDPTELPLIHGHVLEETLLNKSVTPIRSAINSIFHLLGTLPEDTWARHPLYVQLYRTEAKRRIEIAAGLSEGKLTPAQQEAIMAASHKIAVREMKGILFNIERRSNLAGAMKYISPFFSAQENAYKTWLKLAAANPQVVNRGYNVWQAPNRAGLVTDQDGNEVPVGKTSGNDVIWISVPKQLQGLPGLGSLTQMGIPKQSLDIIFQGGMDILYNKGNPNVFSDIFPVGPYVAVPISELVKKQPSLEDSFKWALPYGPSKDAISGFLPAWFNKAQIAKEGLNDPQFARTYELIFATEQTRAKRNGLPPVSSEKILKMTQDYWKMRTVANLIMPFAPRFDTPYKYYLDKSREYKRKYGMEADAKFLDDYPEFFAFTASTSKNPAKVDYTIDAVGNIKKYGPLIAELAKIEPKLIGTVVNGKGDYKFSQAAYNYLYNTRISPDSPQKYLEPESPLVAQRKNEAEKGWIIYGKFRDAISEELKARGLTSVQQKGAEDLAAIKAAVVEKLSIATDADGKPIYNKKTGTYEQTAWSDDYKDSDGSKTDRVVQGLSRILDYFDKTGDANGKNVTWKSVGIYFDFRKALASELLARPAHSIDAKTNTDLRLLYDGVVEKLKTDDPIGFSPLYDRFLTQDLVIDKYLTPKAVK